MSPRKAVAAKAANGRGTLAPTAAKGARKPAAPKGAAPKGAAPKGAAPKGAESKGTESKGEPDASAQALALAAAIERGIRDGQPGTLSPQAFQALMAALCKSYGAQVEAGSQFLPVADRHALSPTDVMTTTSAILRAVNLAVFELGMWQSWTGR